LWLEKKTGRGSRIIGKVASSPGTPKAKKPPNPHSKRRRLEGSPATSKHLGVEEPLMGDPIPIKLPQTKKRSGKVRLLFVSSERNELKIISVAT